MYRYFTAFIVLFALSFAGEAQAQYIKTISGYLPAGVTNELFPRVPNNSLLDTIYQIGGNYDVSGTLKIDEGSELEFLPNSRVIDSAGGKIVANGYTGLNRRILFRALAINDSSHEWGHIVILPNSDSAYFSNVRFVNFRKRNTVDVTLIYSPFADPSDAAFNNAINADINGVGACIATFSHNTYIYDAIVDSCQASFAGGAFAFLQAPAGWPLPDDGRLALASKQVGLLTIRDTRVYNNETTNPLSTTALGGAIYIASNNPGYLQSDNLTCYLGYNGFVTGTPSNPVTFTPAQDLLLFERCSANNTFDNVVGGTHVDYAEGGAIYVGSNTALILAQATFNTDSAIQLFVNPPTSPADANAWGGAVAVSAYSGSPFQTSNGSITDQVPGLSILKTATFRGNVAGIGGAIHIDMPPVSQTSVPAPRLIINSEHFVGLVRDSGKIWFDGNIAYMEGGAIYSPNKVYVTGYLAPNNFPWPGGSNSVELRVEFSNNVAGEGGGSIYLDAFNGGTPDLVERRSWHLDNSVNPFDPRLNPAGGLDRGSLYGMSVMGGGAEFVGLRDSTFATEFNHNFVVGGNGGAVNLEDGIASGNEVPINRYFAENEYNAQNVRVPRDTFSSASIFPYDPRELTRFIGNRAELGQDSALLYNYNPATPSTAHGRGGGLYIEITSDPSNILTPLDSTFISRVRFESDTAYSGSAIWCDRYDFKLMSNQTLIANNMATSPSSATVDLDGSGVSNPDDPNAGATVWADFEGPLPSYESNSRGDAIYDNMGRYILRLPISTVIGKSGADTLRGNFWGETGPAVITEINPPTGAEQSTFFIDYYKGCFTNIYEPNSNPPSSYQPVTIGQIPDTLLLEGRVYDLFDKGTDMKVADYTNPRLSPAEAFSLGLPNSITTLHRFTRNIFDTDPTYVNKIDLNQIDFQGPQPLGYPLFLQADVPLLDSNRDPYAANYTVFMVFNQTTNEFVRVNLQESAVDEGASATKQIYRGRLDFVPDSSIAERHPTLRAKALYTLSLLRPTVMTYNEVQRASMLEDSAALHGREYQLETSDIRASGDTVFSNSQSGGFQGNTTWYAGERYHTLPVRPGDHILVISRTQLWEFGPAYAITHGLQFVIGDVQAPAFVNDVPALQSDIYNPNIKFVHEDVNYNGNDPVNNPETTLFRIGGYDANNFYDPRFLFNQGNYTQLKITVTPDLFPGDVVPTGAQYVAKNAMDSVKAHVRLNHWMYDSVAFNQNITGSNGYVVLKGTPHNPDVVPGGEGVTATLTNWPPNFESEDSLLNDISASQLGPDSAALSMWLFPPSMNCARVSPDNLGANPDTLAVRSASASYHFRIIVMDSLPLFKQLPCVGEPAVLTDSLRYSLDLNTDDEFEDSVAAAETIPGATVADQGQKFPAWDFRYGRTSYDFQTEPSWMVYPSGGQYVPIDPATDAAFKVRGIINVRLDSATAVNNYLLPNPQVNGELNLDTIMGVEANDGHTGKSLVRLAVPIFFVPTILNTSLPTAAEDTDYSFNFQFPDQIRRILIQNLNPSQTFTYKLLYTGDSENLYRDALNQIPAADSMVINGNGDTTWVVRPDHIGKPDTVIGHTPRWLSIDQYSGVLTGTPGDTDAPRAAGIPCGGDTVDVVVSGAGPCGIAVNTWKEFPLTVDSINHQPFFVKGPKQFCVTNGVAFCDSAFVVDRDLLRDSCAAEMLTVTSEGVTLADFSTSVGTITVTPGTIQGPSASDTAKLAVCGTITLPDNTNYWSQSPLPPIYIHLKVMDADSAIDTISYPVYVGEAPSFDCSIWVSNAVTQQLHPLQDIQKLCFGAGEFGTDSLDYQYCEYEDAPPPPSSSFDGRWVLPIGGQLEGSTIDIRSNANPNALITWQVEFQPGNEGGAAGSLYPVEICWNSSCVDPTKLPTPFDSGHFYLRNPHNQQEFSIDMNSGIGPLDPSLYTLTKLGSDSMCLQIRDQGLNNALIVFVPNSVAAGVGGSTAPVFAIEPNYPNPFASTTTLNFSVAQRSNVRIDIYDVKGALVRTLVNEMLDAGSYPVTWDGTNANGAAMPQGNYIAHMTAGSFNGTVKMSLDKGSQ